MLKVEIYRHRQGAVRVSEFPLDIKAAAASMLARCVGGDDAVKYFATVALLFQQQDQLMEQTMVTLKQIGKRGGISEQDVEACEQNQALLDKLTADQGFAYNELKGGFHADLFHQWREGQKARCRSRSWRRRSSRC